MRSYIHKSYQSLTDSPYPEQVKVCIKCQWNNLLPVYEP